MTRLIASIFLALLMAQSGCREHEVVFPLNEEELITTVILTFTKLDQQGQTTDDIKSFSWRDEDGSGDPVIDDISLEAYATYSLSIEILDESKTPVGNITDEIREESSKHQFFFFAAGPEISIGYDDSDTEGKPLGLESICTAGKLSTGSLTVILRHEPDKNAEGVMNGDITNAGGDTDIEAQFNLQIVN